MAPGGGLALLPVGLLALSIGLAELKVKEEIVDVYPVGIAANHAASRCAVSLSSAAASKLLKMSNKLESTGAAGAPGLTTRQLLVASRTWFLTSGDSKSSSRCMRVTWAFIDRA